MRKKYFFFDIDSTLTYRDPVTGTTILPKSTRAALDALRTNGHFISLATGRAHWMTTGIASRIGIDNMVTDGGNGIVLNGVLKELLPLNRQQILPLIRELDRKQIGYGVTLSDENKLYFNRPACAQAIYEFSSFMEYIIDETMDFSQMDIYKIFVSIPEEEEKNLDLLQQVPHVRYRPQNLIIEPADKYAGIIRVMQAIGGDLEDVVVFGDGWNDLDMFVKAPISIAMGNAVDALKERATFVTHAVTEDGIAFACRHFGWI